MENEVKQDQLTAAQLFAAPVYMIDKPEFLPTARKIAKKFISKRKKETELNPAYPVYMTENMNYDPEMLEFANYVAQTAWGILKEQGYAMEHFTTYFESMWCQEHHNMSLMERHIHGNGVVITGFYFLDCPKKSSRVIYHDPRDAKVITNLPETNMADGTYASSMINFEPKEGQLMFSNACLPHSFTKNQAKTPMRFIHFNIAVAQAPLQSACSVPPAAEVI